MNDELIVAALLMAEKHEANPSRLSTTKPSRFRKTADFGLNSASAWTEFNLNLLGADFVKNDYHSLPDEVYTFSIKDPKNVLGQRKLFCRCLGLMISRVPRTHPGFGVSLS